MKLIRKHKLQVRIECSSEAEFESASEACTRFNVGWEFMKEGDTKVISFELHTKDEETPLTPVVGQEVMSPSEVLTILQSYLVGP